MDVPYYSKDLGTHTTEVSCKYIQDLKTVDGSELGDFSQSHSAASPLWLSEADVPVFGVCKVPGCSSGAMKRSPEAVCPRKFAQSSPKNSKGPYIAYKLKGTSECLFLPHLLLAWCSRSLGS